MAVFDLSPEVYKQEPEIHQAFRDFIYNETDWKICTSEGNYYGVTVDRYKVFKAGYKKGLTTTSI